MTTSLQEIRETKLREEFYKSFKDFTELTTIDSICIADFWLAKYESLIKERDAELNKKIDRMRKRVVSKEYYPQITDNKIKERDAYNKAINDVLLLLTTTPTEGGE